MWILALLALVLSRLARAAHNETIDDASPLITYHDATLQRNITAFDSRLLWDGTVTYIVPIPDSSPTITIPFNGTAIYIFVAYPGRVEPAPSGFTVLIDGVPSGNWAAKESALLYRHLVYHNSTLPDASHTLVIQIMSGWEFYFDYAVVHEAFVKVECGSSSSISDVGNELGVELWEHTAEPQCDDLDAADCLTVAGDASTVDILSTATQPAETSTSIAYCVGLGLTLSGTSPAVGGTSQAAGAVTATSSNVTAIIRMTGTSRSPHDRRLPRRRAIRRPRDAGLPHPPPPPPHARPQTRAVDFQRCGIRIRREESYGEKGATCEKHTSATDFGGPGFEMTEDAEVLARWTPVQLYHIPSDFPVVSALFPTAYPSMPAAELPYLSFGHAPPYAMWILTLLHFVLLTRAIHNYTIDDASPLITYNAPVLERNITAFDSHLLWDGTVTYIAPAPVSSPTISIPFNGDWAAAESAQLYHHLVYHNATLPDAPHTLVMQIKPGWELYFDYAIYTSNVDPPPASMSPPTTIPTSSTAAAQQTSLSTKSSDAKKPPLGAIIGAIIGGTLLIVVATAMCLRRRRRATAKRRLTPVRFTAGFGLDNRVAEEEEDKDAGPPAMPFLSRGAVRGVHASVTTERGLARLTAEVRNLTASVQRLETGMPEARDGGQVMLRPPAYGDSRF
ncbi:hypothetical protein B0H13DRAFT_2571441 [Mycena leptocephala]|nr:hypothetical protein B0H13DRAFT_2571441 [Mycena leptocephala]